jgi:hypothetical protein
MSIWTKCEPGLYASPLCKIIRENDGWHAYGADWSRGPFGTLDAAKCWAEQNALGLGGKARAS